MARERMAVLRYALIAALCLALAPAGARPHHRHHAATAEEIPEEGTSFSETGGASWYGGLA